MCDPSGIAVVFTLDRSEGVNGIMKMLNGNNVHGEELGNK